MKDRSKFLIIGGPNTGKTHFACQLYLRLRSNQGKYRSISAPADLSIVREGSSKLNDGLSAEHTSSDTNKKIDFTIEDAEGNQIELTVPDYGGEQIEQIVEGRGMNPIWEAQVIESDTWFLFIRLDAMSTIEDIFNRPTPNAEANMTTLEVKQSAQTHLTHPSFYIELLQMLLFVKEKSLIYSIQSPRLIIILSCWDLLNEPEGKKPEAVLIERLPLLHSFINATWSSDALNVIGLSSTGKTLSPLESDEDFINQGPENFGYLILPNGERDADLTLAVSI